MNKYTRKQYVKNGNKFPSVPQFIRKGKQVMQFLARDLESMYLWESPLYKWCTRSNNEDGTITVQFISEYNKVVYIVPEND